MIFPFGEPSAPPLQTFDPAPSYRPKSPIASFSTRNGSGESTSAARSRWRQLSYWFYRCLPYSSSWDI